MANHWPLALEQNTALEVMRGPFEETSICHKEPIPKE